MASLACNDETIVVTCGDRALALRMKETELHVLEPPVVKHEAKSGNESRGEASADTSHSNACILGVDLSRCNTWLALCTSCKKLSLWDTRNWSIVSSRHLARSAAKVRFTPSGGDVVVADKTGDAYRFSVQRPNEDGTLLLGHLSMLLDILISDNEKYIITCDRDEKIRVSHFPNAYNIQSYCLGHTEFVSCLSFLPHNTEILVSGSGDGSLKFWDYVQGKLVYEINCCHHLEQNYTCIQASNTSDPKPVSELQSCNENSCDCSENVPAVTHMSCCIVNMSSLIGVSIANFKGCLIFKVCGISKKISCSVTQVFQLNAEPWGMHLSQVGFLWYLSDDKEPLNIISIDDCGKVKSFSEDENKITRTLALFNSRSSWFRHISFPEHTCILYKRKFDNVHDYLEKKKARLTPTFS